VVYVLVCRGHIAVCIVVDVLVYDGGHFLVDVLAYDDHLVFGGDDYDRVGVVVLVAVVLYRPGEQCFCVEKLLLYCRILKLRLL